MPLPYSIAPTSAETAPARLGKSVSAPAIELATMKPVAETKRNSGSASPARPPQSIHAATARTMPASAAALVPQSSSRSLPSRVTSREFAKLVAMMPTTPTPNSRP